MECTPHYWRVESCIPAIRVVLNQKNFTSTFIENKYFFEIVKQLDMADVFKVLVWSLSFIANLEGKEPKSKKEAIEMHPLQFCFPDI